MPTRRILLPMLTATLLGACASAPHAQHRPPPPPPPMAEHPAYLHAASDLRYARALLERPDNPAVVADEEYAVGQIDAALGEIHRASYDDGKDFHDHPPVDARVSYTDRFHQALELIRRARQDVAREEDNPYAQGLQGRVIQHIDEATRAVHHAIGDALR